jgi:hypothetical protein
MAMRGPMSELMKPWRGQADYWTATTHDGSFVKGLSRARTECDRPARLHARPLKRCSGAA